MKTENNKKTENKFRYTKKELERRKKTCKFIDEIQPMFKWVGIIAAIFIFIWLLSLLVNNLNPANPGTGESTSGSNTTITESTQDPNGSLTTEPTTDPTDETTNPSDETTNPSDKTEDGQNNNKPEEEENDVPRYITIDLNTQVKDFGKAPVNYPTAWTEKKINRVVGNGVKDAEKVDALAAFNFEANLMFVTYDEKTESYSATFQFNGSEDKGEELKNISVYQDENGNLVVYGYTNDGIQFERVTLDSTNSKREVLTHDVNLPLFAKKESETSIRIADEYTLCVLANEFFAIYKDGQELSIVEYKETSSIKEYDLKNGYFVTKDGQIYTLSVSMSITGEPMVDYKFAGSIKKDGKFSYMLTEVTDSGDPIQIPVFVTKNGTEMVLIPYGWEGFKVQSPAYTDEVRVDAKPITWRLIELSLAERVNSDSGNPIYSFYSKLFAKN